MVAIKIPANNILQSPIPPDCEDCRHNVLYDEYTGAHTVLDEEVNNCILYLWRRGAATLVEACHHSLCYVKFSHFLLALDSCLKFLGDTLRLLTVNFHVQRVEPVVTH